MYRSCLGSLKCKVNLKIWAYRKKFQFIWRQLIWRHWWSDFVIGPAWIYMLVKKQPASAKHLLPMGNVNMLILFFHITVKKGCGYSWRKDKTCWLYLSRQYIVHFCKPHNFNSISTIENVLLFLSSKFYPQFETFLVEFLTDRY